MAFLNGVHHVAYRCKDAKETVEWYQKYLDANFILAIAENQVPSTKEPDPYMHIFIDIGGGQHPGLLRAADQAAHGPRDPTPRRGRSTWR
jgi:catechol 2,3-dioxygenase-like lactoylglutathione lyase family enzyme